MLHTEGILEGIDVLKRCDEGVGKAIGNLQAYAQEHGEYEEERHAIVAEQRKRLQSQRIRQTLARASAHGAMGHGNGIGSHDDAQQSTPAELQRCGLHSSEIDNPHADDEAHGAKHADGRKSLHRIKPSLVKGTIGHTVGEGYSGHEECHTEGVEGEERGKLHRISCLIAIYTRGQHEDAGQQMTE